MKIKNVETLELSIPVEKPWRISNFILTDLTATLVRVTTEDGQQGIGECLTRLGPSVSAEIVRKILAPTLIGSNPWNVEGIWESMYSTMRSRGHSRGFLLEAMSGIDIALWDLLGQAEKKPIWKLLAGHGRGQINVYASSVMIDTPETMAKNAKDLTVAGYKAIKVKIGRDGVPADIARIEAIRAEVGNDIEIMLDANSAYDVTSAIQLGRAAEKLGVFWLEEPVMPDNLDGYLKVKSALSDIRIAAGEGEFTNAGFRELFIRGLIDIAQPDIARAGGFTGLRRIAALADAFDIPMCPHTGASGPVCIAASMQVSAAIPKFLYFEDMFLDNPLHQILDRPLPVQKGSVITMNDEPGLGLRYDEQKLQKFSVNGAGWKSCQR